MQPYYDKDGITIYHGDCREVCTYLGSIDCAAIIADPPYGETNLQWDRWQERWVSAVGAATNQGCSLWCFGSMRMFWEHRDDFAFWQLAQEVIWEKHNGSGFHNDRFRRVHEIAAHFYRRGTKWDEVYKSPQFTMDATARTVCYWKRFTPRPSAGGETGGGR